MAAVSLQMRADRAIVKRQAEEFVHETRVAQNLEQFKVEKKGLWENRTCDHIRKTQVKAKAVEYDRQLKANLQERRRRLAEMLTEEQRAYEQEMVDREETPQQRLDKMAVKAYELKKKREDERKNIVQEKLYQQWRDGIDELRTMDSKIVELKTIATRDHQCGERAQLQAEEKAHDDFYAQLWHEGYLAKIEREEREKAMKKERNILQTKTLGVQLEMKDQRLQEELDQRQVEAEEMKRLWKQQEEEEKEALLREKAVAKAERMKADEYMAIQQRQRAEEEAAEKAFDKNFVAGVIDRERRLAEQEETERQKAKRKAIEFTEALKIEMAQKAEGEERLIQLQQEESERQWAKRYAAWEKEELARRALMEEVYTDRAEQVHMKQKMRDELKQEVVRERDMMDKEVERLANIEKDREEGEALVAQRHQEELFRQMDFHQVQRHRQLQQHAIEQRQAAIAEEKIRRAVKAEVDKSTTMMTQILDKRAAHKRATGPVAPWDK